MPSIVFEEGYEFGLTPEEIITTWSNLQEEINFIFTSKQTWDYNCVMWALHIDHIWKDFGYSDDGYLNPDQTTTPYINFYKENGFVICENALLEDGFEKICIFSNRGNFSHVSRQLADGRWASKMGNYEDIEHSAVTDVGGVGYGNPEFYMKRPFQKS